MRVSDLPGWVPQPGGPKSTGDRIPTSADQVTIERVIGFMQDHLAFACRFEGRSVFYDFPMLDKNSGQKVAAILSENIGRTLLSIGTIEIPND